MRNIKSSLVLVALSLSVFLGQAKPPEVKRVEEGSFGALADGSAVKSVTLRNAKGMSVKVITYGGIMTQIEAPDRTGKIANVILGADTLATYMNPRGFTAAALIGRVANRIAGAQFSLDGKDYKLASNDGQGNTLHGGRRGFDKQNWTVKETHSSDHDASATLSYLSKDGEENFPGNLTVNVTFTLTDDNEVRLDYAATTDKTTPVNFTDHAYFNLAGNGNSGGNCLDHEVWIDADRYTPNTPKQVPTGELLPVKGTPLDFTTPHKVGERLAALAPMTTYDHNFVLNSGGKSLALVARVSEATNGRVMEVRTDQPGLQMYSGNAPHPGLAMETQHFPDSVHHPEFPNTILKAGESFKSTTIYTFSAK